MSKKENIKLDFNIKHKTHFETFFKFLSLVAIVLAYFGYMSWKYDASTGLMVTVLTWSFFVLCTPVADGGFILAFPVRLLFSFKMAYTQIILWFVAIGINIFVFLYSPDSYNLTFLTGLLKTIISEPYPYWSILIISAFGTFLSIFFGDEMMDVASHKDRTKHHDHGLKYRSVLAFGLALLTIFAYYHLLSSLNISIPK